MSVSTPRSKSIPPAEPTDRDGCDPAAEERRSPDPRRVHATL